MKKTYIKPITETYRVALQSIIALSIIDGGTTPADPDEECLGREDGLSFSWDDADF